MSLYSYVNKGDAIIVDGVAYCQVDSVIRIQTADPITTSENISSITFNNDDNNVANGSAHRTWTSCEVAVSKLSVNSGSGNYTGPQPNFTAPSAGVFRIYNTNMNYEISVYKNGSLALITVPTSPGDFLASTALRLVGGDVITASMGNGGMAWFFLPYVY